MCFRAPFFMHVVREAALSLSLSFSRISTSARHTSGAALSRRRGGKKTGFVLGERGLSARVQRKKHAGLAADRDPLL